MKPVRLWLFALGCAVITAAGGAAGCTAGCTIDHHSGDFACTTTAQCAGGRTCSDGFCVVPVDGGVTVDALSCPAQCTSCNLDTRTCRIDCALNNGACTRQIACPTGWNCNIACSNDSSCRTGIDCTTSKSCTVTCSGAHSCRNLNCGAGPCNVACTGDGSCRNVVCGVSCACDITCHANSSCTSLTCKPGCDSPSAFGGCSSLEAGCNTCL